MPLDVISYILAKKGLRLPTLKGLVIDTSKDWQGYRITNLGAPVGPNDAATRIYTDIAATGLGVTLFFLDEADPDVPAYKSMSVSVPVLSESYVEATSNTAGDVLAGEWIAPVDFTVLKLGVITAYLQAERVSGNIDVRAFFRLYERDPSGAETLIAESTLSDLIAERRDVFMNLALPSDYILATGSRLVVKLYVRFLSSGASTTVRLYYQGAVRSRATFPISKEIMDVLYVPYTGARYDLDLNGKSILNVGDITVINTISVGDIIFKNGWLLTEDERYVLVLISPEGKKYKLTLEEVR